MNVKSKKAVPYAVTIVATPRSITYLSAQNLKGQEQKSHSKKKMKFLKINSLFKMFNSLKKVPSLSRVQAMTFLLNPRKLKLMHARSWTKYLLRQ